MATAKRVGQDKKQVTVNRMAFVKTTVVTEVDGIVTDLKVTDARYLPVSEPEYVDQPDRVVLEMSLEEARHVAKAVGDAPSGEGGVGLDTYTPLMAAVYPREETQASPGGYSDCGKTPAAYKGEGSSTYR